MMLSSIFHSRNLLARSCWRVFLSLLCLFMLSGCDLWKFGVDNPMNYRTGEGIDIIDSHYWANSREQLFWANESTVLFTGFESGQYVHYDPGHPDRPNNLLVLWDMQRKKFYRPNMAKPYAAVLCRADEYYVVSAGTYQGHEGTYLMKLIQEGEEYKLVETGKYSPDKIAAYTAECLFMVNDPTIVGDYELFMEIPLADFYFGRRIKSSGKALFTDKKEQVEKLSEYELTTTSLSYSEFKKSYFLLAKREYDGHYALISMSKKSIAITELPDYSGTSNIKYYGIKMTKSGVVFITTLIIDGDAVTGMFIWKGEGDPELLIEGDVGRVAVSPSGCRLAFQHAPDVRYMGWVEDNAQTLKVIELCSEN